MQSPPNSAVAQREIDPCAVVTAEEIAEIFGERAKETKRDRTVSGGLVVTQFFYDLPTYINSPNFRAGSGRRRRTQPASGLG